MLQARDEEAQLALAHLQKDTQGAHAEAKATQSRLELERERVSSLYRELLVEHVTMLGHKTQLAGT